MTPPPLLEMQGIGKGFPGVRALDGVSFDLQAGELHALVGENGAGKSTLMKVLGGVYPWPHYDGTIRIAGQEQRFSSPHDASAAGIAIVYQELSLVKELSVAENVLLGREPARWGVLRWAALRAQAAAALRQVQLDVPLHTPVGQLGVGQQQVVEIAKALSQQARILVLDEPTAALTDTEVERLAGILERLRSQGIGIIYISHRLEEVFRLSRRITVLRDGRAVGTYLTPDLDERRVIALMVGREIDTFFRARGHDIGGPVLRVEGAVVDDPDVAGRRLVDEVSFTVGAGEIVGIAGLMGSGRSELLMTIFGAHPTGRVRELRVGGHAVRLTSPRDAIRHGIALVTEDRKRYGLVLDHSIADNLTLASLWRWARGLLRRREEEAAAGERVRSELRIKTPGLQVAASTLSGGNQQKVVLGKWLLTKPRVLLLDEPTRGIDVGAKGEIYAEIGRLAAEGLAIVVVSSELPEVLGLADRVLVLHQGRLAGEFGRHEATAEAVMAAATGHLRRTA